ncbi:cytochrome P450 [Mycena rosella]|uniref:Cytochrome P450 n=1 Tax=Mycena rosella TaxID=1033263 RepID=A0AAD7GDG2_MYCRO|nr:cytochrome P450 [Mycena rosella]
MLAKLGVGTIGAYALYHILKAIYDELTSPNRLLPGPKSTHWFFGNLLEIIKDQNGGLAERYTQEYGRTMKYHRFFGISSLYTTDTKAIQHFLSRTDIYQKSEASRFSLGRIVGPGVLVVEGNEHKHQNPAFGAPQVRELTSIFVDTSIQLRDIWAAEAAKNGGVARVEILSWLSKATLDMIGLAGFNYRINALGTDDNDTPDELAEAFESLVHSETNFSLIRFLQFRFPIFRPIPTARDNIFLKSQATMNRVGMKLLAESKQQVAEIGTFETGHGRDLLTLLVRANTSKEIPESQQLSDKDVLAQVPTFLVAGHETTSTALTWALFALTQNVSAQTRLREELLSVSTDNPTMDELNELKYLDCVVRETLRVHAPVPSTSRVAMRDDVVPLSTPFADVHGVVHNTIRVRKGDPISIPILALNRDAEIWGPDAMKFIPERWESPSPITNNIPGIWGQTLTFLGGPRSCIGYRFSLVETKALLFTLVRGFEFELAVPIEDIGNKATPIVQRPIVLSEKEKGNQMPLLVRPVVR